MPERCFKFEVPIYDFVVHCYFCNAKKATDKARRIFKDLDISDTFLSEHGGCTISSGKDILIYLPTATKDAALLNTLVHELYHALDAIVETCSLDHEWGKANEPHAYLIGWMFEQIYKKL